MMIKSISVALLSFLLISCSNNQFLKVNWQGGLIKNTEEINYLYWRDGVQFKLQHRDSVSVGMAGFSHEKYIYILIALTNDTDRPITYFPTDSRITYLSGKDTVVLEPIKPKNLDRSHFSFFNTILIGAGSISRLFINLPVDMFIKTDEKEEGALSKIDEDYHVEGGRITKKIFVSNNTIFPEDHYAGFLVFEFDDDLPFNDNQFNVSIVFDNITFSGVGTFY